MRKKFFSWLKEPRGIPLIVFCIVEALLLAAAVTLLILCLPSPAFVATIVVSVPAAVGLLYLVFIGFRAVLRLAKRNMLVCWILNNYEFQTLIMAVASFVVTICFAVFEGVFAAVTLSVWYATLSVYYFMVAFLRGGVLFTRRRGMKLGLSVDQIRKNDLLSYMISGGLLIVMTGALMGIIALTAAHGTQFEYAGVMIYVAAAYALIKTVLGIVNFVRSRKQGALDVQTIGSINVADALVSLLALVTAVLQQFLNAGYTFNAALGDAVAGGLVVAVVVGLGLNMLIRGAISWRKLCRREQPSEEIMIEPEEEIAAAEEPIDEAVEETETKHKKHREKKRKKKELFEEQSAMIEEETVAEEPIVEQTEEPDKKGRKRRKKKNPKVERHVE